MRATITTLPVLQQVILQTLEQLNYEEGYGFEALSEIGLRIETAADSGDADVCASLADELADYLDRVEVDYGD